MRRTNLRPWSQGDDNGLCGLLATVNAVRWLRPELRRKLNDEEEVAALPTHLVRDRLSPEQLQALYLDGDELPFARQDNDVDPGVAFDQSKRCSHFLSFPIDAALG
jgi:hypothetical protein